MRPVATVQQIWNWKSMLAIKYKWMLYIWSSLPFPIFQCARGMLEWRREGSPALQGSASVLPALSVRSWGASHPLWNGYKQMLPTAPMLDVVALLGLNLSLCLGAAWLHQNRSSYISLDLMVRRKICEGWWRHNGCNDAWACWHPEDSPNANWSANSKSQE